MKEPWFWRSDSLAARAAAAVMSPLSFVYDSAQRLRSAATVPAEAGAPVICVGNATLGGAGKTPFCLALAAMLKERGIEAHFLSRGYGGALKGPVRVNHQHTAQEVGDEPLLLAAAAPAWIARDRVAGARAAAVGGAEAIVMDDGFQNPTLRKAVSFLLVEAGGRGGRVFPAGPMREPLRRAAARADAIVFVGDCEPPLEGSPRFRAHRVVETSIAPQKAVAFCGIARPGNFFDGLKALGFDVADARAFADHHVFHADELSELRALAAERRAALITTEKDFVRLDAAAREGIHVARLRMIVDDAAGFTDFVLARIGR